MVVSALLWEGTPGQLITLARDGEIQLFTSQALLDELAGVILRRKFAKPIQRTRRSSRSASGHRRRAGIW